MGSILFHSGRWTKPLGLGAPMDAIIRPGLPTAPAVPLSSGTAMHSLGIHYFPLTLPFVLILLGVLSVVEARPSLDFATGT